MRKKIFFGVIISFLAMIGIIAGNLKTAFGDNNIISWGVTPNTKEQTPDVPKGSLELLEQNNGIFVGDTQQKKVYFSFDLGYEAGYTNEVLDILKQNDIKAIFFLCGNYLKEKELIERMINEGHEIGNHTDKHKDLPTLSQENIKKDIVDLQQKYNAAYDEKPMRFFRPPQGRFNQTVLNTAASQGLVTTLWSIAIVDWGKAPINAQSNADKIASRLHNGALILFHITNSGTPKMLRLLIPQIAQRGYTIATPSELANS